jgi:hypothetical protein
LFPTLHLDAIDQEWLAPAWKARQEEVVFSANQSVSKDVSSRRLAYVEFVFGSTNCGLSEEMNSGTRCVLLEVALDPP